jgi:hypothetical protein
MPFTGKATYDGGATLPELVDDVSDLVGLISPFDTPLLDAIGSPRYGQVDAPRVVRGQAQPQLLADQQRRGLQLRRHQLGR